MFRRVLRLLELQRRGAARARAVIRGTVLYESFAGYGALDNPEALFRELLNDPDFTELRHIWSLDAATGAGFRAEFARDPRVRFVRPGSAAYFEALARSQYLITNATFPPEFQKRPGQIVLNTWHGTPLKLMGYDMPDGAYEAANTLRNFLAADFLLSQNPHMTRMYTDAYRLDGLFDGQILETGYPRTDRQRLSDSDRSAAEALLRSHGILLGDRVLVVYAPTWKGTSFSSPRNDAEVLVAATDELQRLLGDRYLVVLKAHQAVHEAVAGQAEHRPLVSNDIPTNLILGLAEVLITDYSSIFIDFLSTGRQIVFYTPDRSDYARERGTYFSADELPGEVADTLPAVADAILSPTGERAALADRWRREFTALDDGKATARVVDAVFRAGVTKVAHRSTPRRRKVLVYLGGMRSNGITTSALNLLAHLDHEALDVTALIARPQTPEQRSNAARIDSRVRQLHRMGGLTGKVSTGLLMRAWGRLRPSHDEPAWEQQLWRDEWLRSVGGARFDRPVGGRAGMRRSLPAVFALYPRFDALVSVSSALSAANAAGLATRYGIPGDRFRAARNVIDEVSARERLQESLQQAATEVDAETGEVTHPEWADRLGTEKSVRWFVTVGRLSPEKNQARLLDAFALVAREDPSVRLLLVGDGPLRAELEAKRDSLELEASVIMTGALANPFPILARADCFV
jgi:CDP-glycerol glycerophosphotransferase